MAHQFELTDEQYRIIKEIAEAEGSTPEDLFLAWTLEEETRYRQSHTAYYETDEWLRHLGISDERIQQVNVQLANDEAAPDADA